MENMIDILSEDLDIEETEKEEWRIKNDTEADWWIEVHEEKLTEVRRLKEQIDNKIVFYMEKLKKVQEEENYIIEKRNGKLVEYFETLDEEDMKETKTQIKYRLPSGELVKKFKSPEYKRDNKKLTEWLESNNMNKYIEIKKSPKWGELKNKTKVINGQVVTEDGEVVEGVEAIEREPEFKVEV